MLDVTHPRRRRPAGGQARAGRGDPDHPRRRLDRGARQAGRDRRAPVARAGPARPSSVTSRRPGFRIATSGASERQGIVQRLDVGTSGVMVICKCEHAYSVLKNAFRQRTVDKVYHALVQGHPDPLERHHRRADRPAPEGGLQVRGDGRRPAQRDPLRDARGAPVRVAARGAPRDRAHPPDPGAHERAQASVRGRPDLRRRPDARRSGSGSSGSGCTPSGSASSTPTPASTSSTSRRTPTTWPMPSR